ncbi:MAG: DNA repair protein RadA [Methylotenera sp.]|nr:DNA repair protein RadA [Oligoflexia bacterium]
MKIKTQYSCQNCGHNSAKWLGRCPSCEAWSSFVEETIGAAPGVNVQQGSLSAVRDEFRAIKNLTGGSLEKEDWVPLEDPDVAEGEAPSQSHLRRLDTGIAELDRTLGGGLVPDSFVLIGGDPGIGKSTLLLQMAKGLIENQEDLRLLYVSGEESIDQIRGRAHRLGVKGKGKIFLAAETQLEKAFASIQELKPHVVIMDSLQTFSSGYLTSAPGSVSQVREIAARLMTLAKSAGIAVFLVGHVTKDGSIAGPKTVEHMVDTVLYFEGEGGQSYRLLRTVKNRFGSSRELGVFEMDGEGLREVANPSSLFLSERKSPVPGTSIAASLEGSRPILVELQALVAPTALATPRRTSVGMDTARISLLAAILERHMGLSLAQRDLFFNVAGGLRLSEPACDLAAAAAIWSSLEERAFPADWVFIGELALTGEARRVSQTDTRILEAKKLGFKTVVLPGNTTKAILERDWGLRLLPIAQIRELSSLYRETASSKKS